MSKNFTNAFFALLISGCATAASNTQPTSELTPEQWYQSGAEAVKQLQKKNQFPDRAKNVILFVGDGMSIGTITAARIHEGQLAGQPGEENLLSFEHFHNTALVKTYNTNQQTPDSAGTMTAMMSGIKTKAGTLAVNANSQLGVCEGEKHHVPTLLEMAEKVGFRTGIVSTARLTHATPAATYAHAESRNWEGDSEMESEMFTLGCRDIARQLIEFNHGNGLEVAMGGGRRFFLPSDKKDPEYTSASGRRKDNRNLMQEWENKYKNSAAIWNLEQLRKIDTQKTDHLLGLFETSHMQYEQDRKNDRGGEPSLKEMTTTALKILQKKDQRFFLMVEAGRIDHGHHGGVAHRALTDTLAFSDAIAAAAEVVDLNETLILVTADHSHTFTFAGYPSRGNPILGKVKGNDRQGNPSDKLLLDEQKRPYTTLGYANGPGYVNGDQRPDLTHVDTTSPDFRQAATIPLHSETHSGEDVALYATGAGSHMVRGVIEQHVIFHIMKTALNL
ncbi:alkaline phosphatase [Marinicella sp. W31]|uniref:alkaline phosphatase n=1 Tax=Marinicella sp. W31 TaxID=3023713 RepID=UPI003757A88D